MRFRVTLEGRIVSSSGADGVGDDALKALAVAMNELNGLGVVAGNAAIDLVSATGEITISCAVEADNLVSAVQPASDNIYLALHAGEIGTPNWPDVNHAAWRAEFIRSSAEELVTA